MKIGKILSVAVVAVTVAAFASGCAARGAIVHPNSHSNIKLGPKDVKLTKIGEGKSCVPVILNLQFDNPSYYSAQQSGLESAGAELFLDEISYEGMENAFGFGFPIPLVGYWAFILYGDHCTYVEGHGANR